MKNGAKTISIANQKGGVGKTTTSVNLASALAKKNKKVVLIDSDPQGNSSSGVGVSARDMENHFYHALSGTVDLRGIILDTGMDNLKIVPSNIDLVASELELVSKTNREQTLKNILADIQDSFDYIIIDCPPSLGLLTINALTASESVLIPMQCEYFALEGLAQLINTVRSVKKSYNHDLYIEGLLLTMYDRRNKLTFQVAETIQQHFNNQVYKTVIPRNVRLSECPSHGKTIFEYDSRCSGAKAYFKLANEFLKNQR